MKLLKSIFPTRDPLRFKKISCPCVALLKDNASFNVSFQFGTFFYCVYPLLSREQLVCIITHLILHYFVFKLNKKKKSS